MHLGLNLQSGKTKLIDVSPECAALRTWKLLEWMRSLCKLHLPLAPWQRGANGRKRSTQLPKERMSQPLEVLQDKVSKFVQQST